MELQHNGANMIIPLKTINQVARVRKKMSSCLSIVSLVNAVVLFIIVTNLYSDSHIVDASPSPFFFEQIANFFRPNRQTSGTSSSYGTPKPSYNRPNGGTGVNLPNFNIPGFGGNGKRPNGGNGFKLPSFKIPGFGGNGKRPNGGTSGTSSSYGTPKPSYNRPNGGTGVNLPNFNIPGLGGNGKRPNGGNGFKLPNFQIPGFGGNGKRPNGGSGVKLPNFNIPGFGGNGKRPNGGNGFKLPSFKIPGFGGNGKRPNGGASYGPPKKPSYGAPKRPSQGIFGGLIPPAIGGQGRPLIPNFPQVFPTRRPQNRPQQAPSRPRPSYRPTKRPGYRPPQNTWPNQRPTRPTYPSPTRPNGRPTPSHCNACSGPWNTVQQNGNNVNAGSGYARPNTNANTAAVYNQQGNNNVNTAVSGYTQPNNNNVLPTYFPSFPNNGQVSTIDNNRQPAAVPLPTYASNAQLQEYKQTSSSATSNGNLGVNSISSIDSYGSPQAPVVTNPLTTSNGNLGVNSISSIDSYGSPQAPVVTNPSSDNYGSSNNSGNDDGDDDDDDDDDEDDDNTGDTSSSDSPQEGRELFGDDLSNVKDNMGDVPAYGTQSSATGNIDDPADNDIGVNGRPNLVIDDNTLDGRGYGPDGKVVSELEVESPTLRLIEGSGEPEEFRSMPLDFESKEPQDTMFGDEWVPMTLKKAMANVLGRTNEGEMGKDTKERKAKTLENQKRKIMLMDALIDLARQMAKKRAKERAMAKDLVKEQETLQKELNEVEKQSVTASDPSFLNNGLEDGINENKTEHELPDYDDTIWHVNPFRSEQDPVTIRIKPDITTPRPTPTTIRFPVDEFLEDSIPNPLVDNGLLGDKSSEEDEFDPDIELITIANDSELIDSDNFEHDLEMKELSHGIENDQKDDNMLPRHPKGLNLNHETFDRGLSTLATLATLTDSELNEDSNFVGHEGITTGRPKSTTESPRKEIRTIIVRRPFKHGFFDENGKWKQTKNDSPIITPLPAVLLQKFRTGTDGNTPKLSTPSPISILGGENFRSFTVHPTQSTLKPLKFTPTTAAKILTRTTTKVNRSGKQRKEGDSTDKTTATPIWLWQTKEMDEHGNEVITDTKKAKPSFSPSSGGEDKVQNKARQNREENVEKIHEPTIQLTKGDFVILDDSWFKDKSKSSDDMIMPDVLTLPSEPVPTSSGIDIDVDALSSPSPHQASSRLDVEGDAQPLELINPFISNRFFGHSNLGNPLKEDNNLLATRIGSTIAPPTISSIAFHQTTFPSRVSNIFTPQGRNGKTASSVASNSVNQLYDYDFPDDDSSNKNWVLVDPPYSLDYAYDFNEGNDVGSYDEYYDEMYDTQYDNLDKSGTVKGSEIDNEEKQNIDFEDAGKGNYEEEKTHILKSVKDSFRPSINLNSILPSSNAFLPSRGNGKIFREFVTTHNNREGGFLKESIEESDNIQSVTGSNFKSNVDGDHRITSFTSFPLRTTAKTLQQLFSQGQQSLRLVGHKGSHNSRSDGITTDSEFRADTSPKGTHNTKENLSIEQSSFTGISNNKPSSHQPEFNKLRSTNNLSNKRTPRIDPDKLMVYYPLSGKPFLSFPPSKSFSTIAKRQIL